MCEFEPRSSRSLGLSFVWRYLDVSEHGELFLTVGFSNVEIFEERTQGWISGVGRKPLEH